MPAIKELYEKRLRAWDQAKGIIDKAHTEARDLTAEERSAYEASTAEVDKLAADIKLEEDFAKRAAEMAAVDRSKLIDQRDDEPDAETTKTKKADEYRTAFVAYLRGGAAQLDHDQRMALSSGYADDKEVRALSVGTAAAGGYFVPPGYRDEFIVQMKDYGAVQRVAQVINTDTGNNLQWPTMNDTANVGAILAENTQLSEQDVAVGTATLDAYLYTSKLTRASYQLVQDSAFDVEAVVKAAHAERIARILNQHLTTGTGIAQPDGIVTSAVNGKTAAAVAVYTSDELIDLIHSVDPAYRRSPRCRFMMSDTAFAAGRKLKYSGSGEYIFQPAATAGEPDRFMGYAIEINQDMAVPATGVKSVLFGDFYAGYVVRIVLGIQVITFNERYADYLQVAWSSFMRADGTVQNTSAYKALTQA